MIDFYVVPGQRPSDLPSPGQRPGTAPCFSEAQRVDHLWFTQTIGPSGLWNSNVLNPGPMARAKQTNGPLGRNHSNIPKKSLTALGEGAVPERGLTKKPPHPTYRTPSPSTGRRDFDSRGSIVRSCIRDAPAAQFHGLREHSR
jgi:hypothetical protein